jgi:hypothetical protein
LALMKTTLRTVNALPPLKRKFAQSQNEIRDRRQHAALSNLNLTRRASATGALGSAPPVPISGGIGPGRQDHVHAPRA